ncbi:MAG TPA: hypothetical protein VMB73_18305 [Acetobacteraceae bacterium]|nr:hypothetical protein [Acetobacteraceae bacterium]
MAVSTTRVAVDLTTSEHSALARAARRAGVSQRQYLGQALRVQLGIETVASAQDTLRDATDRLERSHVDAVADLDARFATQDAAIRALLDTHTQTLTTRLGNALQRALDDRTTDEADAIAEAIAESLKDRWPTPGPKSGDHGAEMRDALGAIDAVVERVNTSANNQSATQAEAILALQAAEGKFMEEITALRAITDHYKKLYRLMVAASPQLAASATPPPGGKSAHKQR